MTAWPGALHPARFVAPVYYGGLRALGITGMSRRLRNAGLILCYHNVVAGGTPIGAPGLHVTRYRFERQMRWLASRYEVVRLSTFVDRLVSGAPLRSVAAITFDDGYAGVFEHAMPVLTALRLPATVFLVAEAIGRSSGFWWDHADIVESEGLSDREHWLNALRGDGAAILSARRPAPGMRLPPAYRPAGVGPIRGWLDRGLDIGAHSATHRSLPTLSDAELEYEILASRALLLRATGVRPDCFAYPYGRWDPRVRASVHAAGYKAALTLDAGLNDRTADAWSLKRVNVPAAISDTAFQAWTAGWRGRRTP